MLVDAMTLKIKLVLLVSLIGVISFIFGYQFAYHSLKVEPIHPDEQTTNSQFKVINCSSCDVIRVTKTVMSGPYLQIEPQLIWETPARVGETILEPTGSWSITITSLHNNQIKASVAGTLYQELLQPVKDSITLQKEQEAIYTDGAVGGGSSWHLLYYHKE